MTQTKSNVLKNKSNNHIINTNTGKNTKCKQKFAQIISPGPRGAILNIELPPLGMWVGV